MKRLIFAALMMMVMSTASWAKEASAKDVCRKRLPQLKSQLAKDPTKDEAWVELRTCANELKSWDDAVEAAMVAKNKVPDNPEPRIILGMAQMHGKDYERAIEHFDKAIEANPNKPYAYFQMGMAYLFLNQPEKAIQAADRAVELDPRNPSFQRQDAYAAMLLDDLPKAEAAAKAAIAIEPTDIAAQKILAKVYARQGKSIEAAEAARVAKTAMQRASAAAPPPEPLAISPAVAKEKAREHEIEESNQDDAEVIAQILEHWRQMREAMLTGDQERALSFFSDYLDTREQYRQAFARMGPRAKSVFANFGDPYDCEVVFLTASCNAFVTNARGVQKPAVIRFERNPDKQWRIRSF